MLVVNVASACGLTRQYDGLQRLHASADDLTVVGVPCNQFGGQEPGSHEEICAFTDERFGVTFPLTAKLEVNGPGRHPIYSILTTTADSTGHEGDIRWNFEKFLSILTKAWCDSHLQPHPMSFSEPVRAIGPRGMSAHGWFGA